MTAAVYTFQNLTYKEKLQNREISLVFLATKKTLTTHYFSKCYENLMRNFSVDAFILKRLLKYLSDLCVKTVTDLESLLFLFARCLILFHSVLFFVIQQTFTGKHLCWSLFLIKWQASILLKRASNTIVFLSNLRNL